MLARKGNDMYQLLFIDIDGTLKDEVRGIPDSAKEAIIKCREQNCYIIICTGRSIGMISDDVLQLQVDGYITGGGSYISFKQHVLQKQSFFKEEIQKVVDVLTSMDVAFAFETNDKVFMNTKAQKILTTMNLNKQQCVKNTMKQFIQEKITYEDNIRQYRGEDVHKLYFWANQKVFQKVKGCFTNKLHIAQHERMENALEYFEIVLHGCDKGSAVQVLQAYLQIQKRNCICFGDGLNDMDMFHNVGTSIAMASAHEDLKRIATSICEDVFEDGLYKELMRREMI